MRNSVECDFVLDLWQITWFIEYSGLALYERSVLSLCHRPLILHHAKPLAIYIGKQTGNSLFCSKLSYSLSVLLSVRDPWSGGHYMIDLGALPFEGIYSTSQISILRGSRRRSARPLGNSITPPASATWPCGLRNKKGSCSSPHSWYGKLRPEIAPA